MGDYVSKWDHNGDTLRDLEHRTIREFLEAQGRDFYSGSVLDLGAGRQPYRDLVEGAGGEYVPYDAPSFPASCAVEDTTGEAWRRKFDVVICTQVIQYVDDVGDFLSGIFYDRLVSDGTLLLTGPLTWPEVENEDSHRFTRAGIRRLLSDAGFFATVEPRGPLGAFPGFDLHLGWQAVARV